MFHQANLDINDSYLLWASNIEGIEVSQKK